MSCLCFSCYTILLGLLITGCGPLYSAAPTPTATVIPFPTFTATPAMPPITSVVADPSPTLSPTATIPTSLPPSSPLQLTLPATLPAPLYYLDEAGQIQRVVGVAPTYSVEQVTYENAPITDFDLSLVHGRLIYVTDDYRELVEFDPVTNQRVVKLANVDRTPPANGIETHTMLRSPRYSPDGTQISFAYNGINLMASGLDNDAQSTVLQADAYALDIAGKMTNVADLRIYQAATWSPTGAYLLFHVGLWEGAGYELYNLQTGGLTPVHRPNDDFYVSALPADGWAWGDDEQSGYIASADMRGYGPGLFHFALAQGTTTQLTTTIPSPKDTHFSAGTIPRGVFATPAGALYLFLNMKDAPTLFQLYQWQPNQPPQRLNETPVTIAGEVLWTPDGRGALVVTERGSDDWAYPLGPVQWIAPAGGVYTLHINGHHLRWGVTPMGVMTAPTQAMAYVSNNLLLVGTYPQGEIYVADQCTEVMKHVPQASIMRLATTGGKAETLVENAGQLALAPPQ